MLDAETRRNQLLETLGFWWTVLALIFTLRAVQNVVVQVWNTLHLDWPMTQTMFAMIPFGFFIGAHSMQASWRAHVTASMNPPQSIGGRMRVVAETLSPLLAYVLFYLVLCDQEGHWMRLINFPDQSPHARAVLLGFVAGIVPGGLYAAMRARRAMRDLA